MVEHHQSAYFQYEKRQTTQEKNKIERGAKHSIRFSVLAPQLESQKPLYRIGRSTGQNARQAYNAPYNPIYPHVLDPQIL